MERRLVNTGGPCVRLVDMGQGHPYQNVPKVQNGLRNRKNLFSKCFNERDLFPALYKKRKSEPNKLCIDLQDIVLCQCPVVGMHMITSFQIKHVRTMC